MNSKILLIGELLVDTTIPVRIPANPRTRVRRAELIVYEQISKSETNPGGVFYIARFLRHFSDLNIVYPIPNTGLRPIDEIKRDLEKEFMGASEDFKVVIERQSVDRYVYEATRLLEVTDLPTNGALLTEESGFIRIDSGDSSPMCDKEISNFIGKLNDHLNAWNYQNRPACIFFADYDLGLFTAQFIEQFKETLKKLTIPPQIVVYAGRNWRKFATLPNCTIVSDKDEAIENLMKLPGIEDEKVISDNPLKKIVARFHNLKGFVLVDRKNTDIGVWKSLIGKDGIEVERIIYQNDTKSPRTPTGHRALIAAGIALCKLKGIPLEQWLPIAHEAAKQSHYVLRNKDVKEKISKVKQLLENQEELSNKIERMRISPMRLSLSEIFGEELLNNHLLLKLSNAKTKVPGYLTVDPVLRRQIEVIVDGWNKKIAHTSVISKNPLHGIEKLLIFGPPGSGKSILARAIGNIFPYKNKTQRISEHDIFNCTGCNNSVEKIVSDIKKFITRKVSNVSVLDEIDKISNCGRAVHSKLLRYFDDFPDDLSEVTLDYFDKISLVIIACSRDESKFDENDNENLSDFYNRFTSRISVPKFSDRPLDGVYILAEKLYNWEVRHVSLAGLQAIVDTNFSSGRQITKVAKNIVKKSKNNTVRDEDFISEGILNNSSTGSNKSNNHDSFIRNRLVTIVP